MTSSLLLFRNVCLRLAEPRDAAPRKDERRDGDAQHPVALLLSARRLEVTP